MSLDTNEFDISNLGGNFYANGNGLDTSVVGALNESICEDQNMTNVSDTLIKQEDTTLIDESHLGGKDNESDSDSDSQSSNSSKDSDTDSVVGSES
jgi:hypothetical protein